MRISMLHSWISLRSTTLGCTPASLTLLAPTMSRREPWAGPWNMCWFSTKHPWLIQVLLTKPCSFHLQVNCEVYLILSLTDIRGEEAGRCFGASIGLNYPVTNEVTAGFHVGGNNCKKDGSFSRGKSSNLYAIPYSKFIKIPKKKKGNI